MAMTSVSKWSEIVSVDCEFGYVQGDGEELGDAAEDEEHACGEVCESEGRREIDGLELGNV